MKNSLLLFSFELDLKNKKLNIVVELHCSVLQLFHADNLLLTLIKSISHASVLSDNT